MKLTHAGQDEVVPGQDEVVPGQDPPENESGDATNGTSTPTNPSANGEGTMTVAWIIVGVLIVLYNLRHNSCRLLQTQDKQKGDIN